MISKLGRNDPCLCGSAKKFKHCCFGKTKFLNQSILAPKITLAEKNNRALRTAYLQKDQGNLTQAEFICHQIIQIQPNHSAALNLLGILMLQDGRMDLASEYFKEAIVAEPKNPEFFCNLGLSYHEQGLLTEAEKSYRRSLSLDPNFVNAYYNLHALLLGENDFLTAVDCLRKVVKVQPLDHDARFMLGVLLDYKGAKDEASSCFGIVSKTTNLMRSRLDAWDYIKSANIMPKITGSGNEIFKLALDQSIQRGLVLEFGVRFGTSIRQIARLVDQKVHGFDSFEGLPEVWHHEPKGSYTTKGEIPDVPKNVDLHVGWFEDTLPVFLESNHEPIKFINIDCDIYSSTVTILDNLASRVVIGSVIVFDEYIGNEHWREDEFKAFQESVKRYSWEYEYLYFSFFTKQVAIKITKI